MIGFLELAVACQELEAFEEARVSSEGILAFTTTLGRVRRLAERSARATERMLDEMDATAGPRLVWIGVES